MDAPRRILILKRERCNSIDFSVGLRTLSLNKPPGSLMNTAVTETRLILRREKKVHKDKPEDDGAMVFVRQASVMPITPAVNHLNPMNLHRGLVADAISKEGKRTWGSKPVQDSTVRVAKEIVLLGQPTGGAQLSLYRSFCRWRSAHIDTKTSIGQTLAIFGGYLIEAELKASTCVTYVKQLETLCKREPPSVIPPEWSVVKDCIKGLELMALRQPRDHAPDISQERAIEIINGIQDDGVAFTIWAMCMCGARSGDLLALNEFGFTIVGGYVHVHFLQTKARRRQDEQYSVDLPIWYPLPARLQSWSQRARPFVSETKRGLFICDADRINRILHKAGFVETSYSFRRLFINGIIDRFTEDGITNWLKVIELSGHETPKVVKSLYKDHSVAHLPSGPHRTLTLRRT